MPIKGRSNGLEGRGAIHPSVAWQTNLNKGIRVLKKKWEFKNLLETPSPQWFSINYVTVKNIETWGHSLLFISFFSNKNLNISKCLIDEMQLDKKICFQFYNSFCLCRETYSASKMYAGLMRLPMARLQFSQVKICIINMTSQRESWGNVLLKSVLYIIYI